MSEEKVEEAFEVAVTGTGVSVKKAVSGELAGYIVSLLMGGARADTSVSAGHGSIQNEVKGGQKKRETPAAPGGGQRMSLREFMDATNAQRNPDKITAIGQYLIEHEGAEDFTRESVKAQFRIARETAPKNFPRDFNLAAASGWIAEDTKKPGHFYVTKTGRDAIEGKFATEIRRAGPQSSNRRKRRNASQGEESE